jgi:CheY-like chemotaxis protein
MKSDTIARLEDLVETRGKPFKILIVDDEQWIREIFRDFCDLTRAFQVDLARSGAEALQLVGQNSYDLVTLDLIMPDMSGIDALTAIKEVVPSVPIMVITGNATDKLVKEAGVLGASKVMYKPVSLADFMYHLSTTFC